MLCPKCSKYTSCKKVCEQGELELKRCNGKSTFRNKEIGECEITYKINGVQEYLRSIQFEDVGENKTEPIVYDDRIDIIDAYMSLPAKDKREIHKTYLEEFGKYGIELKMKSYCPECSQEEEISLDLVDSFFRAVYSA